MGIEQYIGLGLLAVVALAFIRIGFMPRSKERKHEHA